MWLADMSFLTRSGAADYSHGVDGCKSVCLREEILLPSFVLFSKLARSCF